MELMQASHQWATRPADERFVSLLAMQEHFDAVRQRSRELVVANRRIEVMPAPDNKGLLLRGPNGGEVVPSHWAFGQLAALAEAPAGYLRQLPSPVASDCLNYGLRFKRTTEDVGLLLTRQSPDGEAAPPSISARACTGPRYGRIWNSEILRGLTSRFGDGIEGPFRVPGEFGKPVEVAKANTTLFAGDQDMFVFLADESRSISIPSRRHGEPGPMSRGFFVWNSEVGAATFGVATFLFDYVCQNRIVWGAREYKSIRIRHTPKAPERWAEEIIPALQAMSESSTDSIDQAIARAREARIDHAGEDVNAWLEQRFGKRMAPQLQDVSMDEEERPIETIWDAVTAATAFARRIPNQDTRVALETRAGALLDLVAA